MTTITRKCIECGKEIEVPAILEGMIDPEFSMCEDCTAELNRKMAEKKQAEENGEQVFI